MAKGDELYPHDFSQKAQHKLANLMKHGYEIIARDGNAVRVKHKQDDLIILDDGEVFKKVLY